MDKNSLRKIVENRIKFLEGNEFQEFCDRLCLKLYPDDYTPVRAGGPKGDMTNDGYCPKARVFFAAHATRGEEISKTKTKITKDLKGCLDKHSDVAKWIYLTNDTLVGETEKHVDGLRNEYSAVVIETWGHKKIAEKILKLEESEVEAIIDMSLSGNGHATSVAFNNNGSTIGQQIGVQNVYTLNEDNDVEERGIIDEIFNFVLSQVSSPEILSDKERINLDDKIKLNFENSDDQKAVQEYFRYAFTKVELIEKRIQQENTDSQNDLHSFLYEKYYALKLKKIENIEILHVLFNEFIPFKKNNNPKYCNLSKAFVLFFFDDCTIFEKTKSELKKNN